MPRHLTVLAFVLFATLLGCSSGDGGGSGGAAGSGGSGGAQSGGGAGGASGGSGGSGGACKLPGESCGAGDACNVWICRCNNTSVDFNTIGSCQNGTCSTGTQACENICANSGGVKEAVDSGCSL